MANRTQEARSRRSAARDRRRSRGTEQSEEQEAAPDEVLGAHTNGNLTGAAAKVVGTAVAAGLLGALGGAAKALLERRAQEPAQEDDEAPTEPTREREDDGEEPEARGEDAGAEEEERDEPEARVEEEVAEEDERPEPQAAPEPQAVQDDARDSGETEARAESPQRAHGISSDRAGEIASAARRHLEGLLGTDPERVSGLERADGSWHVMLEVVEVPRIPESTDVLATYELVLDDDGNLVSATRRRRYRRSQIDEES